MKNSDNVSNAELLEDITRSQQEVESYKSLSESNAILANAPGTTGAQFMEYMRKARYYMNLENETRKLLNKLADLKRARNL